MGGPVTPLVGEGMITRRVRVAAREVVFVKGVLEASDGLAVVFAEAGGDLTIAAPASRAGELDEALRDLAAETGALVSHADASASSAHVASRDAVR